MDSKRYLFVCGCPRSGTTVLSHLLGSHSKVAIGIERFKLHYQKDEVSKELFSNDRFFDFRNLDTDLPSANLENPYYRNLQKKFSACEVLGDKSPRLFRKYPLLDEQFGDQLRVIFIVRDIFEVAASFNKRSEDANDPWPDFKNYQKAVNFWNQSLLDTRKAVKNSISVLPVSYQLLFNEQHGKAGETRERILEFLNLEIDEQFEKKHLDQINTYTQRISKKENNLSAEHVNYIKDNARFKVASRLVGDIY